MGFGALIAPETLPSLKIRAIELEETLRKESGAVGRAVNIDPGYLTASALVMATAKDFSHRVPLAQGIYAHLEFLFTKTGVKTLEWTYPDLRREPAQAYFRSVRESFLRQIRERRA